MDLDFEHIEDSLGMAVSYKSKLSWRLSSEISDRALNVLLKSGLAEEQDYHNYVVIISSQGYRSVVNKATRSGMLCILHRYQQTIT